MAKINFPGKASGFLKIGVAAAARGDVDAVRAILSERPRWTSHVRSHGRTLLWEASHRGRFEMVTYLVGRGADIDACGTHYTPYFVEISCYCIARHKKHDEVADFLLKQGATVDIHTVAFLGDCGGGQDALKQNPESLNEGHPKCTMGDVKDDGLDFHLAPAPWAVPLCYALRGGNVETVKSTENKTSAIRLLLDAGADPFHANRKGKTPLSVAEDMARPDACDLATMLRQTATMKSQRNREGPR